MWVLHWMDTAKRMVKISLEPLSQGTLEVPMRKASTAMLGSIRKMVQNGIAVDRGHKFSDGRSEVNIWIEARDLSTAEAANEATAEPRAVEQPSSAAEDGGGPEKPPSLLHFQRRVFQRASAVVGQRETTSISLE